MRLRTIQAALMGGVMAVAGCDGGGGPTDSGPPPGLSFLGTWQLHVDAQTNCWADIDVRISIDQASLTAGANGLQQLMNPDGWWYVSTGPDHPSTLSGNLNPGDATVSLLLWQGTQADKRGHFDGVATSATHLSGTFTDPDVAFRNTSNTHPCTSTAHAIKD